MINDVILEISIVSIQKWMHALFGLYHLIICSWLCVAKEVFIYQVQLELSIKIIKCATDKKLSGWFLWFDKLMSAVYTNIKHYLNSLRNAWWINFSSKWLQYLELKTDLCSSGNKLLSRLDLMGRSVKLSSATTMVATHPCRC